MPLVGTGSPPLNDIYSVMMTNGMSALAGLNGTTTPSGEEISTIFVVGFPDDMQEREFQNMFIFSPGFEAATLKIPKDQEDDNNNLGPNGTRRQIIGFAKFRTRLEALEARDTLSGRKVDAEKGSILKAEMAKKNLHTKRGLASNEQQQQAVLLPQHQQQQQTFQLPLPPPSSSASAANIIAGANKRYSLSMVGHASAYEAFHSVPPALPSDRNPPNPDFYPDMMASTAKTIFSPPATRAVSFDAAAIGRPPPPPPPPSSTGIGGPPGAAPSTRTSRFASVDHPYHHPDDRFNMFAFPSLQSVSEENMEHHYHHHHNQPLSQTATMRTGTTAASFSGLTISTTSSTTITSNGGLPSPGVTSPTSFRSFGGSMAIASSDHNPPCNTLYVGNLPNNANEEELKAMFAKCIGYLRLSFRNKSNGPMCFVEFEDVAGASQAMQELYGAMLSNSVKGGIRLSFSKNPLGVRADGRRESIQQAFEQLSLS